MAAAAAMTKAPRRRRDRGGGTMLSLSSLLLCMLLVSIGLLTSGQCALCLDEPRSRVAERERERNLPAIAKVKESEEGKAYGRRYTSSSPSTAMQLSVLVETVDGHVHAFDALSGEKLWKTKTGGSLVTSSIANKRQRERDSLLKAAIVPGVDGHLYSVKPGSQVRLSYYHHHHIRKMIHS